jgi:hypothetical protein
MKLVFKIVLISLVSAGTLFLSGCGVVGSDIRLEGLNLGRVDMEGKTISGLPSDKINLDLDVAAQTIKVAVGPDETVITVLPSGGSIHIKGDSVALKGLKPDQVKVEWAAKPSE